MNGSLWQARPVVSDEHLPRNLHPVVRRVYATRGMQRAQEADLQLKYLLRPSSLKGLDAAAGHVADAITAGHRIAIAGDFDADGATASALCVRALLALGAADVRSLSLMHI